MTSTRSLLLVLALGACGGDQSPAPAPTPSNTAPPPTFEQLLNAAPATDARQVDGTGLGADVEAYLVRRFGAWQTREGESVQLLNLELVLAGDGKIIRVDLGYQNVAMPTLAPFGALDTVPARDGGAYDPEHEAFRHAPPWPGRPPIFAVTVEDASDNTTAFGVSIEGEELVVRRAQHMWRGDVSPEWERYPTIQLSLGAHVLTPTPRIAAPVLSNHVVVITSEREVGPKNSVAMYDLWLRVGDRFGQVALELAEEPDHDRWVIPAVRWILPAPLPDADVYLAHRVYRTESQVDWVLLGRVGDELVGWARADGLGFDGLWSETLRVPLPDGAMVEVR